MTGPFGYKERVFHKFPRTPHVQGSRRQPGDEDLGSVPFAELADRYLVVEEKLDGANAGISFTEDGRLRLQSRGHVLSGGPRERQFAPLKAWAAAVAPILWDRLGSRYVVYGEWLYAKHTVFYDALPHYFCEFDVLDRATGVFLSTAARAALWVDTPVVSVPVLHEGTVPDLAALVALLGPSLCRTGRWRHELWSAAAALPRVAGRPANAPRERATPAAARGRAPRRGTRSRRTTGRPR